MQIGPQTFEVKIKAVHESPRKRVAKSKPDQPMFESTQAMEIGMVDDPVVPKKEIELTISRTSSLV